jgi:hypothetical protein
MEHLKNGDNPIARQEKFLRTNAVALISRKPLKPLEYGRMLGELTYVCQPIIASAWMRGH